MSTAMVMTTNTTMTTIMGTTMATMGSSGLVRRLFRAGLPLLGRAFRLNMGIDPVRLAAAREQLPRYIDRLETELAWIDDHVGGKPYGVDLIVPNKFAGKGKPISRDELTTLVPDEHGVNSLARQIKITGRAFPLFDIARLIVQKPERYSVRFTVKKGDAGRVLQPIFLCALDDTLWLSEDEAVAHVMSRHFGTFYQAERTATEPPKGVYTFVAQCGVSGVILGPPNHHDYQNQLRKLHAERFGRMPFDVFKSRIKKIGRAHV